MILKDGTCLNMITESLKTAKSVNSEAQCSSTDGMMTTWGGIILCYVRLSCNLSTKGQN